jgi:acetyltransferase-like isoleucine patch superfamily enzyme
MGEGSSVGAGSMVTKSTDPWTVYIGQPAKRLKPRAKTMLSLESDYLNESP